MLSRIALDYELTDDEQAQFNRNCENANHRTLVETLHARRFTAVARHLAQATPDQIEAAIRLNPGDVIGPDDDGEVALRTSAAWIACCHPDLIPPIVTIGADIDQAFIFRDFHTCTLLGAAVFSGLEDVVSWLIDAGATLDPEDPGVFAFYTPLFIAVENNLRSMVELLLLRGASANHKSGLGPSNYIPGTPLERSLHSSDPHILELLLAYGGDANTCPACAVGALPLDKLEWFLSNTSYNLHRQTNQNDSVLYHVIYRAIFSSEEKKTLKDKVKLLVQKGAPVESAGALVSLAQSLLL